MGRRRFRASSPPLHKPKAALQPYRHGCTWKRKYETEDEALNAMQLRPAHMRNQKPYKCRYCEGWHMATIKE